MIVAGHLHEPGSSARVGASLARTASGFLLTGIEGVPDSPVTIRWTGRRLAGVPQSIIFEDGRRFLPLHEVPPGFLDDEESRQWLWIDRLEHLRWAGLIVVLAVLVLGAAGIRAAMPAIADFTVELVPASLEAEIGRRAFRSLDGLLLSGSRLGPDRKSRIRAAARTLAARGGLETVPEIVFRESSILGANAFALPSGPVLITDGLVRLLDDDETVAVLAHEFGHVEKRHGLRQVVRTGGLVLVASMIFGGDGSLVEETVALASSLSTLGYSRDFEREADMFAADLLTAGGRSPGDLADALEKLGAACGPACKEHGWLSTHPTTGSRAEALRAYGRNR